MIANDIILLPAEAALPAQLFALAPKTAKRGIEFFTAFELQSNPLWLDAIALMDVRNRTSPISRKGQGLEYHSNAPTWDDAGIKGWLNMSRLPCFSWPELFL